MGSRFKEGGDCCVLGRATSMKYDVDQQHRDLNEPGIGTRNQTDASFRETVKFSNKHL